jgi:phage terminase large subunit
MVATLIVDRDMARLIATAKEAGCPSDQTELFLMAGYIPIPGFLPFHAAAREADKFEGPEWIALGGKRGPGKSHAAMAQAALDDCQRVPGLKFLFLRKVMKTAQESLEDLVRRLCANVPHKQTANEIEFPNGSRILLGGFKDERDIDKYLGIEYDGILIEECTQLSEKKKDAIRGSLRTSKGTWRPRIYLTTNADGAGLMWFKKMFVLPARAGMQTTTRFIDVTHITNPFINPEYQVWLDGLTGPLRKAWRDGDWDAFAGMSFPDWNHGRHVCKPFDIPDSWPKWRATDWGFRSPFCTLWFAKNMDTHRIYVYREYYQAELTDREQAEAILFATPPNENAIFSYADPSMWERKNQDGKIFSTVDEYRKAGVILTKADNNRLSGMRKVHNILADLPDGDPGLQVFENCPRLIEQMESLACDSHNPEDVDTEQEDHAFDTLKYGLTNESKAILPPPRVKQHNPMESVLNLRR